MEDTYNLVAKDADGELFGLSHNNKGDRLPDFSKVGYRGGLEPPVDVPVVAELSPSGEDDTQNLQAVIDQVAKMPIDENGFRGAIQLNAGRFLVGDTVKIHSSGIVLKGKGECVDSGTIIEATTQVPKSVVIMVEGSGKRLYDASSKSQILDRYVPVGERRIKVSNPEVFAPGDRIVVVRPGTKEWIKALKMDPIEPNPHGIEGLISWTPEQYTLRWERTVESVENSTLVLDIPVTQALDANYGGGWVQKFVFPGRIQNIGVENLRIVSRFDPEKIADQTIGLTTISDVHVDEDHAWIAVKLTKAENCWVRDVTGVHLAMGTVWAGRDSKSVTITDCQNLDPVSIIRGGRRYSFNLAGELALVKDCYSRKARHDYAVDSRVCGPNAFVNCLAEDSFSTSETHHRYATGVLFDNVQVEGTYAWLMCINRSYSGTGHGWSGAQVVFWNCSAAMIGAQKPPLSQNFIIGYRSCDSSTDARLKGESVQLMERFSLLGREPNGNVWGDAWIYSPQKPVYPESLYKAQRKSKEFYR